MMASIPQTLGIICKRVRIPRASKGTKPRRKRKIKPKKIKKPKLKFKNNETCGISSEKILSDFFNISFNTGLDRVDNIFINNNSPILKEHFSDIFRGFRVNEHIGNKNESSDFKMEIIQYKPSLNNGIFGSYIVKNEKSLSLKTNFNTGDKVAPQNIGQGSRKKFKENFKHLGSEAIENDDDIREFFKKNHHLMIKDYFQNLFCCHYLLWIKFHKNYIRSILMEKGEMGDLKQELFTYTPNREKWKSVTLKYDGYSIGEFQIESFKKDVNGNQIYTIGKNGKNKKKGRDGVKFRFIMSNINYLLPVGFDNHMIETKI